MPTRRHGLHHKTAWSAGAPVCRQLDRSAVLVGWPKVVEQQRSIRALAAMEFSLGDGTDAFTEKAILAEVCGSLTGYELLLVLPSPEAVCKTCGSNATGSLIRRWRSTRAGCTRSVSPRTGPPGRDAANSLLRPHGFLVHCAAALWQTQTQTLWTVNGRSTPVVQRQPAG